MDKGGPDQTALSFSGNCTILHCYMYSQCYILKTTFQHVTLKSWEWAWGQG